jgi:hypothetical protein
MQPFDVPARPRRRRKVGQPPDWNIPAFQQLILLDTLRATDSILTHS